MRKVIFLILILLYTNALGYYNASDEDLFGISSNGEKVYLSYGTFGKEIVSALNKYKALQDKIFYSDNKNLKYGICQYEEDRSFSCTSLKTGKTHLKYVSMEIQPDSPRYQEALHTYKILNGKNFNSHGKPLSAYLCDSGCNGRFAEMLINVVSAQ